MEDWTGDIIVVVILALMVFLVWKFAAPFPEDPRVPSCGTEVTTTTMSTSVTPSGGC